MCPLYRRNEKYSKKNGLALAWGCHLLASELSQSDVVCWKREAGIVQRFFNHPERGLYLRYTKLTIASTWHLEIIRSLHVCLFRLHIFSTFMFFNFLAFISSDEQSRLKKQAGARFGRRLKRLSRVRSRPRSRFAFLRGTSSRPTTCASSAFTDEKLRRIFPQNLAVKYTWTTEYSGVPAHRHCVLLCFAVWPHYVVVFADMDTYVSGVSAYVW